MIHADIFEAIRAIEPSSPVLNLKDKNGQGLLRRHLAYDMMTGPNGKTVMIPRTGMNMILYRGQRNKDWICDPVIYRNATEQSLLIDRLKVIDFSLIAEQFPPVYYARQWNVDVDMLALAQHYEIKTDMLDLTSDISVAAFFAVTKYNDLKGRYEPMHSGVGSISTFFSLMGMETDDLDFRIVGLQPFARPGQQCAFGIRLPQGATLESLNRGNKIYFQHNPKYNQQIMDIFGAEKNNTLFPKERIADAAKIVRDSTVVTERAIDLYCAAHGVEKTDIKNKLKDCHIDISPKPIFRLTKKENEALRRQFRSNPFGNVEIPIFQRLMYTPSTKQ